MKRKIIDVMKSYHGRFVPMFHWANHAPMKIWYDEQKNSICVDCGITKAIPNDAENFDENMYDSFLNELEDEIIIYFKEKWIELLGVED